MEVSGQPSALPTLYLRKNVQYPRNSRLGEVHRWLGCFFGEDVDLLSVKLSSHLYNRLVKAAVKVSLRVNPR